MTLRLCFLGHAIHTVPATAQILLPCLTICYHDRACDGTVDQVGLDSAAGGLPIVTKHYQGSDLSLPHSSGGFTKAPPPLDGITHSDDTMCYVGLLRLYGRGDDRHLYDVGILIVWTAVGVYELLCVSDGMEVARVLC